MVFLLLHPSVSSLHCKMWNLDLKRTVPLKQDHVPAGVLRAQKPSCPHCEEVSGKLSLRPSRGLHMELVHTDILSVPCGL